tara:strand:- start:787 stop:1203 length:417 start_codon:yes stop_codon:yes gene_type:complete
MKLFDYIKILFGKDKDWDKVSNYDKSKNSFMSNRFMSIKFPIQANLFNTLKVDPVGQAEAWRLVSSKFNRVPGFIYTKVKKSAKQKAKEWNPNPKALELYMKYNEIGEREYKEALKYNQSLIQASIDTLEKQIGNDVN